MKKIFFALFLSILFLSSCEDVIDVNLKQGEAQLAVDAFLNNLDGNQTIRLTITSAYLDNSPAKPATGATVRVTDQAGNVYNFADNDNSGKYIWTPTGNQKIGAVDDVFTLNISYGGENYNAVSRMKRVPLIDSLQIEFRDRDISGIKGHFAELYARDLIGRGDCYWIKGFKNGKFNDRPTAITTAYDATFDPSGGIDGFTFIRPLRRNSFDFVDNANRTGDERLPPLNKGDVISAEIHSINENTYDFLKAVSDQLQNGGLFARPPSNVPSNILNTNSNSKTKAVGFFNVAAVSKVTKTAN
ncbi:MAG: DUF4249 domain-containing protein [Cytophagales bacterium]|nr:MAG: DUF4249 domain-containing protein [Cytophagales bacterium]